jgi:hypothetical protein
MELTVAEGLAGPQTRGISLEERNTMMYFYGTGKRPNALLRIGSFHTAFPEARWWAGRHAVDDLDIDLEQDDYRDIVRNLERWELPESHSSVACIG